MLPTVSEDDVFSAMGGFEFGQEGDVVDMVEQASSSRGAEPTRTLLVRNIVPDAPDEELQNIFQVMM